MSCIHTHSKLVLEKLTWKLGTKSEWVSLNIITSNWFLNFGLMNGDLLVWIASDFQNNRIIRDTLGDPRSVIQHRKMGKQTPLFWLPGVLGSCLSRASSCYHERCGRSVGISQVQAIGARWAQCIVTAIGSTYAQHLWFLQHLFITLLFSQVTHTSYSN
jgi:hypothetical protein